MPADKPAELGTAPVQEPPAANLAASATPVPPLLPACGNISVIALRNANVEPLPAKYTCSTTHAPAAVWVSLRCVCIVDNRSEGSS